MFIKVKKVSGYPAKIETDSVIKYEQWNDATHVVLENGCSLRFTEPSFEEFDALISDEKRDLSFTNLAKSIIAILWIILMGALIYNLFN